MVTVGLIIDPYQYIIALYGLHNVFLIDFDKKTFIIRVSLKKISFCLKPSKRENFVETFVKMYILNPGI